MQDDLSSVKDDMTAFIEGHGMRRFQGYVTDEVQSVMWETDENLDGWKDFVELARNAGATFLTMNDAVLDKEDVDLLVERLHSAGSSDDDVEEARWLRSFVGKTGFVQLGWPYQGTVFLFELSTAWYDRYQHLMDVIEEYGGIVIDEADDDER